MTSATVTGLDTHDTDPWLRDVTTVLAAAGERLAAVGLSPGSTGNISVVRDGRVAMTGTGTDLSALGADDIAEVALDGTHIRGPRPSKEVAMHLAMYARNPTHRACVHVHSPYSVAASCLAPWSSTSAVPPITPYFVMRVGQTPLVPYRAPGHPEIGTLIRDEPTPSRAVLLANHGQVVSGADMTDALDAAIELEEACRISVLTAGHDRRLLTEDDAVELAERYGTPWTRREPPLQ